MSAAAPQPSDFLIGHLLVAMPGLDDPRFARAVVLLCQHNEDGAMGLLVNRLSDYRLSEILAQMQISDVQPDFPDRPVLAGGPVQTDRGFVLHGGTVDWDSTLRINETLAVSTSRDVLEMIAAGKGPAQFLLTLGFSGWGPGQLESELADNAWLTVPADDELLFDVPLDLRWQTANARLGVDPGQLTGYAGHA
ncbi:MAG: YqgE/AlgH family protein [Xanthomonadaceae bacterium]|nr:YqgE/AlgH family protein [Xanthomonadaceae bacterium]MDP2184424.1 YqgE/AlgH family protein [Xanthomonadales bacterium]MDZ4115794.1 YqgE/AlgH family protein [Xanthomonadaceae bacterium]MDZ4379336.1 YqgE/AlgH family protein [Xanthomonadaceae bacterium]